MKTWLDILGWKEFVAGRLLWGWPITPALTLQVLRPTMIGHPASLVVHMSGVIQKERHFWFDSRVVALNFLGCLRIPWGTCHTARFLHPPLRWWPRRSAVGLRRLCFKHPGNSYSWAHSSGAPSARLEGKSGTFPKPLCPHVLPTTYHTGPWRAGPPPSSAQRTGGEGNSRDPSPPARKRLGAQLRPKLMSKAPQALILLKKV